MEPRTAFAEKHDYLPLNLEIRTKHCLEGTSAGREVIHIGNSGLQFVITSENPEIFEMHYLPDRYVGVGEIDLERRHKYAVIFSSAFYDFISWWESNRDDLPSNIVIETNERMGAHIFRVLGQGSACDILGYSGDDILIAIDLEEIIRDSNVLAELQKTRQNLRKENFLMKA